MFVMLQVYKTSRSVQYRRAAFCYLL